MICNMNCTILDFCIRLYNPTLRLFCSSPSRVKGGENQKDSVNKFPFPFQKDSVNNVTSLRVLAFRLANKIITTSCHGVNTKIIVLKCF